MEAFIFFGMWAAAIFLMMRFGCGKHIMGPDHAVPPGASGAAGTDKAMRWVAPRKDSDPVCGKTVATDAARPSVHDGNVYYFCSRECREIFEAAPDLYVGAGPNHPALENSHV